MSLQTLPQYETYKDSGIEWLGKIPDSWLLTRLGTKFYERRTKVSDVNYPPLSVTKSGILPQLDNAAKTKDGDNRKLVKLGDFVINSRSDRKGSSGISGLEGSVSLINIVLEPKDIHPRFCHHLLKSYTFIEEYYRVGRGIVADLWTTRYDEMRTIIMALPSYAEQTAIAHFLDQKTAQIDAAIAIKEKQIALLKERKQILIQQAVTQGLDPTVPMKDSGVEWIGEIPAHWEVSRLKYESKIQSGITLGKVYKQNKLDKIPYIRVANVQNGYFKLDDIAELFLPKKEYEKYFLQNKDILVTEGGDLDKLGRGTVWNSEIRPCIHQNHVFAIRVNNERISPEFIACFLETNLARRYFINSATKTTNLASTNRTHLGNLPVFFPSVSEQISIAIHLSQQNENFQNAMDLQQQQIEKLREYKTTLINSAVTGKIRVTPEMVAV